MNTTEIINDYLAIEDNRFWRYVVKQASDEIDKATKGMKGVTDEETIRQKYRVEGMERLHRAIFVNALNDLKRVEANTPKPGRDNQ